MTNVMSEQLLSNEQLLALAEEPTLSTWQLYELGSVLGERAAVATNGLRQVVEAGGIPRIEDVHEQAKLISAKTALFGAYAMRTGQKGGCSMEVPAQTRRTS